MPISGSKNAALKMLAAATLTGERCRFTNVPEIEDVRVMAETLRDLGVVVDHPEPNVYEVASGDVEWLFVPLEAAAKMRASFMLLGPLLQPVRPGHHQQPGRRPDRAAAGRPPRRGDARRWRRRSSTATATTSPRRPGRLRGTEIRFPFVSVMGTENAMLAATLAEGHTVIRPAAQEPEVDDLIAFLQKMGAEVERTYPDTIEVVGRQRLRGAEHHVIPDRIEAGTFVVAAAVTGGRVTLTGAPCDHLTAFLEVLGRAGVDASLRRATGSRSTAARCAPAASRRATSRRRRIPGLATDIQPPTSRPADPGERRLARPRGDLRGPPRVAGRAQPDGRQGRHRRQRTTPRSTGPTPLHGAEVEIGDLRAGASLILAALAADGDVDDSRRAPRPAGV